MKTLKLILLTFLLTIKWVFFILLWGAIASIGAIIIITPIAWVFYMIIQGAWYILGIVLIVVIAIIFAFEEAKDKINV